MDPCIVLEADHVFMFVDKGISEGLIFHIMLQSAHMWPVKND